MTVKKMITSSLFCAFGVFLGTFIYFPIGPMKIFPIQHMINVLSVVLIGPMYGIINAFIISLIRNLLSTGSLLAFPGSMIGAALCGLLYYRFKNKILAGIGELIGTGIIGALACIPIAALFMDKALGAMIIIVPFFLSSLAGVVMALLLLKVKDMAKIGGFNADN